ncbi:competence/damage-inducible protein A [Jeotgalibacillus campisalis]|uniref:Putative competence-damage inducible protein n=1 Tax=Jeotgalibacillus campisalis TaxID=220754 RepID=A0A0C2VTN0_9BACL|nr:competence/damage-inducible protein A [Jeotgalibacillus campisalis]KIL47786.1 damage-inducible protein [Jeotgalibacillus campisalis]
MNAEIIAVGSELLLGQIANTNAQFISQKLAEAGIDVYRHSVVGDNQSRLLAEISAAQDRAELIILTGGLGPTKDDLTKETVAQFLGKKLVMHDESLHFIEQYFKNANKAMTANNQKQALIVEGSDVLVNHHGMAPGMILNSQGTILVLLPGPPREMKPMLQTSVIPRLLKLRKGEPVISRVLRYFGIGEAELEDRIEHLIHKQINPTIAPLASDGEVTLRISAKHSEVKTAQKMLDVTEADINSIVGKYMYGKNDETLLQKTFELLSSSQLTIASAESLTAGLFASQIGSQPGASSVLKGGLVCYTNEAKMNLAGVSDKTLAEEGAVSKRCAIELAEGVKNRLGSDIGISFTGSAGPESLEGQPLGTVWIGIAFQSNPPIALHIKLQGERNYIRLKAVKHGLFHLIQLLEQHSDKIVE